MAILAIYQDNGIII